MTSVERRAAEQQFIGLLGFVGLALCYEFAGYEFWNIGIAE